jgi:hypothetical protein
MAFQVRVTLGNGEVAFTDVSLQATPTFGSKIYVLLNDLPIYVHIVGLSQWSSATHGKIDLLEGNQEPVG